MDCNIVPASSVVIFAFLLPLCFLENLLVRILLILLFIILLSNPITISLTVLKALKSFFLESVFLTNVNNLLNSLFCISETLLLSKFDLIYLVNAVLISFTSAFLFSNFSVKASFVFLIASCSLITSSIFVTSASFTFVLTSFLVTFFSTICFPTNNSALTKSVNLLNVMSESCFPFKVVIPNPFAILVNKFLNQVLNFDFLLSFNILTPFSPIACDNASSNFSSSFKFS